MKTSIFVFLITLSFNLLADAGSIKLQLEADLKTSYFKTLENVFGECAGAQNTCLESREDFMQLTLPKKTLCFPYTLCGFYNCMESKYQCANEGITYFTKMAYPACNQYLKNIDKKYFSEKGIEWIYAVMVCLQKEIINDYEVNNNCANENNKKICSSIAESTLKSHPGCYINSGVGVCHLPMKDKINIWKTISATITKKERKEAYQVVFHCLFPTRHANNKKAGTSQ